MKSPDTPPAYYFLFTIVSFLTSVLWIYTIANEVVGVLTTLGFYKYISFLQLNLFGTGFLWQIDSAIMGLTFLAWGNSVSDFVADVSLTKLGKQRTAVSLPFLLS